MALAVVFVLTAAACSGNESGDGSSGGSDGSGDVVNVLGAFVDEDARDFVASAIEPFTADTGIDVEYEGSENFETLVRTRVEGGNPPDVMLFPQPGYMASLARGGVLRDLEEVVDVHALRDSLAEGLFANGVVDGTLVGVPYRLSFKSLIWYPVPHFEEAGYQIPATYDELFALSQRMVADGNTPWCIGMEASGATGWVATDWIEDIMLRTAGADAYDRWVIGELRFDSPEVTRAFEEMSRIWFTPGFVRGGPRQIVTQPVGEAPDGLFDDPPSCYLHRQANFITASFPDGAEIGEDVEFFFFPEMDVEGNPALVAGDVAVLLTEDENAEQFIRWLAQPESGERWAESGSFLSPHADFDASLYANDALRRQGEFIAEAPFSRYDASDLMPPAVGTGAFWTQMVHYVNQGGGDPQPFLTAIDRSWPQDLRGQGIGQDADDVGSDGGGSGADPSG